MPSFITDGLRTCQIDAVTALEVSMGQNRPRALVQMATGAGKTFTACTLSYRLLARRIQARPVPSRSRQPRPPEA